MPPEAPGSSQPPVNQPMTEKDAVFLLDVTDRNVLYNAHVTPIHEAMDKDTIHQCLRLGLIEPFIGGYIVSVEGQIALGEWADEFPDAVRTHE